MKEFHIDEDFMIRASNALFKAMQMKSSLAFAHFYIEKNEIFSSS